MRETDGLILRSDEWIPNPCAARSSRPGGTRFQ